MKTGVDAEQHVRAGVARRKITPPIGVDLTGYIGRPGPSAKVHDDLYATAAVIDDGSTRIAIITLDLLGISLEQDALLRKSVSQKTGVHPANLLIACSHTHGGPATQFLRGCGTPDECYLRWLFAEITATAAEANECLSEARLSLVNAQSGFGINRRGWVAERMAQADAASGIITDPEIMAFVIDIEGRGRTVVYNYACHGVVMGNDNVETTADWPGAARAMLENSGKVNYAMFLQGCCGDINPSLRGTFEQVSKAGEMVGEPLLDALAHVESLSDATIRIEWQKIEFPYRPLPSEEEIAQEISFRRDEIERKRAQGSSKVEISIDVAMLEWAQDALKEFNSGGGPESIELSLQAIAIGKLVLLNIPGEVFCGIGLNLKSVRKEPVMVVGYANGNIGYIPTAATYCEGGYETEMAHKYYGIKMIGPESERILLDAGQSLVEQVGR